MVASAGCEAFTPVVDGCLPVAGKRTYRLKVRLPGIGIWHDAMECRSASMAMTGLNYIRRTHPSMGVKVARS